MRPEYVHQESIDALLGMWLLPTSLNMANVLLSTGELQLVGGTQYEGKKDIFNGRGRISFKEPCIASE